MWGWGSCVKYETPEPELRWFLRDPPVFEVKDRLDEGRGAMDNAMENGNEIFHNRRMGKRGR